MGGVEAKMLPPWYVSEGVEYEAAISQRIQALSAQATPFLHANPQYFRSFDLESHLLRLQGALEFDKNIAMWYPKLVPKRVSEIDFWQNYFSNVAAIVGEAPHAAAEEYKSSAQVQVQRPATATATTTAVTTAASPAPRPAPSASPAVPASALSPPPLHNPSLRPMLAPTPIFPPGVAAAVRRPGEGITPQHMVDDGRDLGASIVAKLAGLHHNLPSHHHQQLPASLFANMSGQQIRLDPLPAANPAPSAAAAAVGGVDSRLDSTPPLRWGIVGCGQAVEAFTVPALLSMAGARVVCVTSRTASTREAFAAQFGIARVHETLSALLADPEVDAVYIATPPGSHMAIALEVARARKPCVIEKAFARTGEEARVIQEAFQQAGLPLYLNQHKRFLPKFLAVQQLLKSHVGTVQTVHYQLANPLAKQLFESSLGSASPPSWRMDAEQSGGGLVMEFGSELLDVVDFLFGPVSHVHGDAIHSPLGGGDGGSGAVATPSPLENILSVSFRVGDPSVAGVATAAAAVAAAGANPAAAAAAAAASSLPSSPILCTANFNFVAPQQVDQLVVQGSKAQLTVSLFGVDAPIVRFADGKLATLQLPPVDNPHAAFLQHVTQELRVFRSSRSSSAAGFASPSASTAVRTGQVLCAALRSYYKHRNDSFWTRPNTWQHGLARS